VCAIGGVIPGTVDGEALMATCGLDCAVYDGDRLRSASESRWTVSGFYFAVVPVSVAAQSSMAAAR
jgi:hypothetical protein